MYFNIQYIVLCMCNGSKGSMCRCLQLATHGLSVRPRNVSDWSCHSLAWTKASQSGKSQAWRLPTKQVLVFQQVSKKAVAGSGRPCFRIALMSPLMSSWMLIMIEMIRNTEHHWTQSVIQAPYMEDWVHQTNLTFPIHFIHVAASVITRSSAPVSKANAKWRTCGHWRGRGRNEGETGRQTPGHQLPHFAPHKVKQLLHVWQSVFSINFIKWLKWMSRYVLVILSLSILSLNIVLIHHIYSKLW